jgi:diguanylate cyclase (GGDEF)-like protein
MESLDSRTVSQLSRNPGTTPAYMLRQNLEGNRRFRLSGPIWTKSFGNDGVLDFDPNRSTANSELLGFVAVTLDFSAYQTAFLDRLKVACVGLMILLLASWAIGRALLKRALRPLSELQEPLSRIGRGETDVSFPNPRHKETQAIVGALGDTLLALQERERHLSHLANHDALTGLYSRHRLVTELDEEIAACAENGTRSALCFVDLDQFKYINDTCGHPAGDQFLKLAAEQLRNAVRSNDFVARFGGDEFVLLLRGVSKSQAREVVNKVLARMRNLSHVEQGHVFHLQCSIGVAPITSSRFGTHEVLSQADMACQTAKANGRNRVEFYNVSAKQSERMVQDIDWMLKIRHALDHDELFFHYQPLLHISTGMICHYEALLRMKTEKGVIGPQTFLPAAARFGLMEDIDSWVVKNSIQALAKFSTADSRLSLSVNLSTLAFESPVFATRVRNWLNEYGVSGEGLCFEITEQMAVRFAVNTDKQITMLRDMGCRIAVDDFGTGYSSFSYLKRLPVDYLKIDGSFIRELTRSRVDQIMVRMIAEVAQAAGLQTVAEYVESAAALKLLGKYGIDYAQGFYVGRGVTTPRVMPFADHSKEAAVVEDLADAKTLA